MIKRTIENIISERFFKGKVIIILGSRQVGKTTLIKKLEEHYKDRFIHLNCDEPNIRLLLEEKNSKQLKALFGKKDLLFIDEAQRVKNIGITLKLIVDNYPECQILATGSSAFELANEINEPLTGRKYEYQLFPLSIQELSEHTSAIEEQSMLENRLIYGLYPEIVTKQAEEKELLHNLTNSYLFKDILSYKEIRKPDVLEKLLRAIALQIGNEVSYNELSNLVGVDKGTIERYIDLLEKNFIVFRLNSLSRNQRNELKKSKKIYFYDNGIRNAIISNFNSLDLRADVGALWENFLICERLKQNQYFSNYVNIYFWRTMQQQEIDYIEEKNGKFYAFEFKWRNDKKRIPITFLKAYPDSEVKIVTKENYLEFITNEIS